MRRGNWYEDHHLGHIGRPTKAFPAMTMDSDELYSSVYDRCTSHRSNGAFLTLLNTSLCPISGEDLFENANDRVHVLSSIVMYQ